MSDVEQKTRCARWSDEEKNLVVRLYRDRSISEISALIGRSVYSVERMLGRLGVGVTDEERNRRVALKRTPTPTGEGNPNWKGGISKQNYHYKKIQRKRYPERVKARDLVRDAILSGRLIRGVCEVCGDPKTDGHHDDYSKPLEVRWLCPTHHREFHKQKAASKSAD